MCFWAQSPDCEGEESVLGEELRVVELTSRLARPVDLVAPDDGSNRLFVVEQGGTISIVDLERDAVLEEPFLDLTSQVICCREEGLLGLAFHPEYRVNGEFFVNYVRPASCGDDSGNETVVSRFRVSPLDPDRADPASEEILLVVCQPRDNHNGGQIRFGPHDGYFYVGFGDGGIDESSQDGTSLLGKIIRVDVDSGEPFAIPSDNPFVGDPRVRDEVWCLGLRNPWRFAFDPATDDLYIGDVGGSDREEVDFHPGSSNGGGNFGWPLREGTLERDPDEPQGPGELIDPVFEFPHSGADVVGNCVIGGVVYRGCAMPDLHGRYFFGSLDSGRIFSLLIEDGQLADFREHSDEIAADDPDLERLSTFGTDARGELYACQLNGRLYRFVPASTAEVAMRRGDADGNRQIDVNDAVYTIFYTIGALETAPSCLDALDTDDDGQINLTDAVDILNFLFLQGAPLSPPFGRCGADSTPDTMSCDVANCP